MRLPLLTLLLLTTTTSFAAPPPPPIHAPPIDAKTRQKVIAGALDFIDRDYVFPDGAKKLIAVIKDKQQHGAYDKITDPVELARTLKHDFDDVLHDPHLGMFYTQRVLPPDPPDNGEPHHPDHAELEHMQRESAFYNFGFARVEILDGNIGYLRLDGFDSASIGGETAAAAMAFVANSDALIFDLRYNHGGDPTMVQLLGAYLFEGDPVHTNDFVFRDPKKTTQYWTSPWVPGKHYVDKPVYVLTSHDTFSCAEEFTYDLQTQKRSTTIGEPTGGGAHPVSFHRLTEHLAVAVPFARALNPITHTDWEGKGVLPDVAVPAEKALAQAKLLAAKKLAQHPRDAYAAKVLSDVQTAAEAELKK